MNTSEHMISLISVQDSPIRPPPIPYSYETPSGLAIDLRLFNKGKSCQLIHSFK